jgi:hypothetical protein
MGVVNMRDELVVNPLGEVFLNDKLISGSINLKQLAEVVGREPTEDDIKKEFEDQIRVCLNPDQANRVKTIWEAQKRLNNGQIRVWLSNELAMITTEFLAFIDEKQKWRDIYATAADAGASVEVFYEESHIDHRILDYGKPNQRDVYGENHGRTERQVSINVTAVPKMKEIEEQYHKLKTATDAMFHQAGVGVI